MARGFSKNKIAVSTITSSYGIEPGNVIHNKWINKECGEVIYFTLKKNRQALIWWIRASIEILRKKSEIIHFNSLVYSVPFILILPFLNRKIIWSVHGELYDHARSSGRRRSKNLIWMLIRLLKKRIHFHSTCSYETKSIQNVFGEDANIIEIPLGLDIPKREVANSDEKYFSFIGRINSIKALDYLIKAFSESSKFLASNYKFLIAGTNTGAYSQELVKLIQKLKLTDKIEFIGHVNGQEKNQFLASSSFNFLISHSENFGVVVLESLAQGTPVVASHGTPWEVLNDKSAGFWINNSIDELKIIIDTILDLDKKQYNTLKKNALNLVQDYSTEKINTLWLDYFNSTELI